MCTLHQIIWMISEGKMGGTCRTHHRVKHVFTEFWLESLKGRDHLQNQDSRVKDKVKVDYKELGGGHVAWTHMAQDRVWWWAVVDVIEIFESY